MMWGNGGYIVNTVVHVQIYSYYTVIVVRCTPADTCIRSPGGSTPPCNGCYPASWENTCAPQYVRYYSIVVWVLRLRIATPDKVFIPVYTVDVNVAWLHIRSFSVFTPFQVKYITCYMSLRTTT